MEYSNFIIACNYQEDLNDNYKVNQNTLYMIQKLFEKSYTLFFLSKTYTSALWYNTLLEKFKNIIENDSLIASERLQHSLSIYKLLFVKYKSLKVDSNKKMIDIIHRNDNLSQSA